MVAIGQSPAESKRLLRKIHTGLAEVAGMMFGAEKMDDTVIHVTASSITERTSEIEGLLKWLIGGCFHFVAY